MQQILGLLRNRRQSDHVAESALEVAKNGRSEEALGLLESAIAERGPSPALCRAQAAILETVGRYEDALSVLYRTLDLGDQDQKSQYQLGKILIRLKEYEAAARHLESSIGEFPDSGHVRALLGLSLLELSRLEEAERRLSESLDLSPNDPDAIYFYVMLLTRQGQSDKVHGSLQSYVERAPRLASSHGFMANYLDFEEANLVAAFEHYETALRIATDGSNRRQFSYYLTTENYPRSLVDDYVEALVEVRYRDLIAKVLTEFASDYQKSIWTARLYSEDGEWGQALEILNSLGAESKQYPDIDYWKGRMHLRASDYEAALPHFQSALKSEGSTDWLRTWCEVAVRVVEQIRAPNHGGGIKLDDHLSKDSSEDEWLAILEFAVDMEDHRLVLEACNLLIGLGEQQWRIYRHRAHALKHLGEIEEALSQLRWLKDKHPDSHLLTFELANEYAKCGMREESDELLGRLIRDSSTPWPLRVRSKNLRDQR